MNVPQYERETNMTTRIWWFVALGVLLAAPGAAMAEKFTKKTIDMQSVSVPVRREPAPKQKIQVTLGLTIEELLGRLKDRIQDITNRQIAYMRDLIRLTSPDDPQLPDYYFRLGELFVEKHRYSDHFARSFDGPIFRAEHAQNAGSGAQPQAGRGVQ